MGHDGDVGIGLGVAAGGEGGLDPYFGASSEPQLEQTLKDVQSSVVYSSRFRVRMPVSCAATTVESLACGEETATSFTEPRISELSLQKRQPDVSRLVRKARQLIEVQIPIKAGCHAVDAARVFLIFLVGWQAP